jgi:cation:H+ antiporter
MAAVAIVIGLGLLATGAELLVRGASRLARALGLSPLIVGLTVVAYGTSAPEFAVSMKAALSGQADIALGNVVGSNTFNILFILGLSALIAPLLVSQQLVRLAVPLMIAVSGLTWALAADGTVSRAEGMGFVAGILACTYFLARQGWKTRISARAVANSKQNSITRLELRHVLVNALLVIVGLAFLAVGARWVVSGAANLARFFRVSELLIGLTIVSAGTSLPELATSVIATVRGERDIAVGNVVGSNIFNIMAVLGASAAISGRVSVAPAALHLDIPVMVATALVCLPVFFTGGRISRWEGALFLGYYAAYVLYLTLAAARHEALSAFNFVMLWFALPATALGIGSSVVYAIRARKVSHDRHNP